MSRTKQILFFLMVLFVVIILFVASQYLDFEVKNILVDKGDLLDSLAYRMGFYGHIIFGMVALAIGPSQFIPKLRSKHRSMHRVMGKGYVLFCMMSGVAGLYIAQHATGGWITRIGFSGLAITWLYTTFMAFLQARRRNIASHQIWMFRSYAVTFAAVTLRLYLGPMMAFGVDFDLAYKIVSFACWIPNLIIVESTWIRNLKSQSVSI